MEPLNVIDISMKALIRECPTALLRLAGVAVDPERVRLEDPNVNLPELRADHVFVLEDTDGVPEGAIYLEYQLHPDPALLTDWFVKCGGLTRQLGLSVALLVIYLEKGDRATFPDRYTTSVRGLQTEFHFAAVCLWEYAKRIEQGEFPELAPLLVLCYDSPTEETVQREVEIIQGAGFPDNLKADMLALALRIASRRFARELLEVIFREELPRMQELGIIEEWIAQGEARGEARGEAAGRNAEARNLALKVLTKRLGVLPQSLTERIDQAEAVWCERLIERALEVETLAELNWENMA